MPFHYAKYDHVECCILFLVMLNVVMLSVIMLSVAVPSSCLGYTFTQGERCIIGENQKSCLGRVFNFKLGSFATK